MEWREADHPRNPDGTFRVRAGALVAALAGGGRYQVRLPAPDLRWVTLAEARRSTRNPERVQIRDWGVRSRHGSSTTVPIASVWDDQRLDVRPAPDWAASLAERMGNR